MVDVAHFRRPFSWLKFAQLVLGMVCFGLYMHYSVQVTAAVIIGSENSNESFVRITFTSTCLVGFPFIFVLATIISFCLTGDSLENSVLCFLLNFIGFGMYLTIGAIIAHNANEYNGDDPIKATAAMCIITSFFYFCDVIIYLLQKFKK